VVEIVFRTSFASCVAFNTCDEFNHITTHSLRPHDKDNTTNITTITSKLILMLILMLMLMLMLKFIVVDIEYAID